MVEAVVMVIAGVVEVVVELTVAVDAMDSVVVVEAVGAVCSQELHVIGHNLRILSPILPGNVQNPENWLHSNPLVSSHTGGGAVVVGGVAENIQC